MKNLYKIVLSLIVIVGVFSCDEDDTFKLEQAEGSFLIEVPNSGSSIVLDRTNPSNQALTVLGKIPKTQVVLILLSLQYLLQILLKVLLQERQIQ